MSQSGLVYSVPSNAFERALGSRSTALKDALSGAPEQVASAHAIIDGLPPSADGPTAIHGFELLCRHLGRSLPNRSLSPLRSESLKRIDAGLATLRAPLTLVGLLAGGAPIPLSVSDDFPTVGHIGTAGVQAAAAWDAAIRPTSRDALVDGFLSELSDWLALAGPRGDMLVGFWY